MREPADGVEVRGMAMDLVADGIEGAAAPVLRPEERALLRRLRGARGREPGREGAIFGGDVLGRSVRELGDDAEALRLAQAALSELDAQDLRLAAALLRLRVAEGLKLARRLLLESEGLGRAGGHAGRGGHLAEGL